MDITFTEIIGFISLILVVVGYIPTLYKNMREKKWNELKKNAYNLFVDAETAYAKNPKSGKKKMNYVFDLIYKHYAPKILKRNYTSEQVQLKLQMWFEEIKGILHTPGKQTK